MTTTVFDPGFGPGSGLGAGTQEMNSLVSGCSSTNVATRSSPEGMTAPRPTRRLTRAERSQIVTPTRHSTTPKPARHDRRSLRRTEFGRTTRYGAAHSPVHDEIDDVTGEARRRIEVNRHCQVARAATSIWWWVNSWASQRVASPTLPVPQSPCSNVVA